MLPCMAHMDPMANVFAIRKTTSLRLHNAIFRQTQMHNRASAVAYAQLPPRWNQKGSWVPSGNF